MSDKFKSRKFYLTISTLVIVTTALFTGFLNGGEFIAGMTIALGVYTTGNVMESKK